MANDQAQEKREIEMNAGKPTCGQQDHRSSYLGGVDENSYKNVQTAVNNSAYFADEY